MALRMFTNDSDDDGRGLTSNLHVAHAQFAKLAGIVFDMGDVLFDATEWRRWLLQLVQRMGLQTGYRSFFSIWDHDFLDDVHRGRRDYAAAFDAFLRQWGFERGQIDEIVHASNIRKRQIEAEVRPFPGVRNTLTRLQSLGLRMAVLSDSESTGESIRRRLEQLGLGAFFAAVVSSADLKAAKPDRACYAEAIHRLNLRPDQAAFVGHDADELRGARRAGLKRIAVNYDRDVAADCYLKRFDDLLSLFAAGPAGQGESRRAA